MGIINEIISAHKKFKRHSIQSYYYALYEKDNRLYSFTIIEKNIRHVERYIENVCLYQIDDIEELEENRIFIFSIIDSELKAKSLKLIRE